MMKKKSVFLLRTRQQEDVVEKFCSGRETRYPILVTAFGTQMSFKTIMYLQLNFE